MPKDFSWGFALSAAIGFLFLAILVKIISPSLPAQISSYVPSSLKS